MYKSQDKTMPITRIFNYFLNHKNSKIKCTELYERTNLNQTQVAPVLDYLLRMGVIKNGKNYYSINLKNTDVRKALSKKRAKCSFKSGKLIQLCNKIKEGILIEKFRDYKFIIDNEDLSPFDPKNECVDIKLITKNGEEYYSNFITRKCLDNLFEKNKKTGECINGTYFCMPYMVIVEEISEQNVKVTIDDLIKNLEIEDYFQKIN